MPETGNDAATPELGEKFDGLLGDFVTQYIELVYQTPGGLLPPKVPAYKAIKDFRGRERVKFVRHLFNRLRKGNFHPVLMMLFSSVMRTKIEFDPEEALSYIAEFLDLNEGDKRQFRLNELPFGYAAAQLERALAKQVPTQALREQIALIVTNPAFETDHYTGSDLKKVGSKLLKLSRQNDDAAVGVAPYLRFGGDPFGEAVAAGLAAMADEEQSHWHALFHEANAVAGARPSKKYLAAADECIDRIGGGAYRTQVLEWLQVAIDVPVRGEQRTYEDTRRRTHEYTTYHHLTENNRNLLRGMVWTLARFGDAETLGVLARFAERCFDVIPGRGPAATAAGNAGLLVLAEAEGLDGVSQLSRLKLRIRQPATRKTIQQYIEERAAKLGLKPATIEELAAPDFDLDLGERSEAFGDYTLTMTLSGIGKVDLQWHKPDGSPQKSAPAFVKSSKEHADRLKTLQAMAKEIQGASTAQRDRIDRLFVEDMSWSYDDFEKFYLDHGVVSVIARKLIWQLVDSGSSPTAAVYVDDGWQSVTGAEIRPGPNTTVRPWHPIDADPAAVVAWRDRLDALGITQPMKQAFREVYVVTDAERATGSYSNRMAAHILKQHQFSALAGGRGWNYALLGANDDGRDDDAARRRLPAYGLAAEYWIDELHDEADRFNDSGIWDYVATDQVRFLDADDNPIDVDAVPPIVFSEVMRDVDLFVGVASVGNDPEWQDRGATREERDYWQAYSFGDLNAVAQTRKAVLERLLPRLRIRDQARIDGKFLVVDGKRHTYKIHIGSTNILILPNDRYLCIVPGRGRDRNTDGIHLPFEGDRGLSIVLSKAFMLADDDKITDPSILSQL